MKMVELQIWYTDVYPVVTKESEIVKVTDV